jgi:uncharacterized membrane protein (GlpM family)
MKERIGNLLFYIFSSICLFMIALIPLYLVYLVCNFYNLSDMQIEATVGLSAIVVVWLIVMSMTTLNSTTRA